MTRSALLHFSHSTRPVPSRGVPPPGNRLYPLQPIRIPATGSSTSHEISALAGRMAMTLGDSWTSTRSLERCVLDFPDSGDSAAEFFTGGRTAAAYLTVAHSDGVAASDG